MGEKLNVQRCVCRVCLLFLILFLIPILSNANTKFSGYQDTLVLKPYRDTSRITKAQVHLLKDQNQMIYYKPRPFEFVTNVPGDFAEFGKAVVARKNLPTLALLVGSTAVLVAFDQQLLDAAQQFGRFIHLDAERKFKRAVKFNIGGFELPLLDLPQNLNSSFYFMGEGWPSILLAGGMWGYGSVTNDYRARQTASQIAEMFLTLGVTTQALKRITGRQSPFNSTSPGGQWHPFTNPSKYQENVSNFDAFPSGHLATFMATVTILSGNYPDCHLIKPIGYSLMGLLGFAMMNNGVHWAGDYPVAIAIGYTYGKIALKRGQRKIVRSKEKEIKYYTSLTPMIFGSSGYGLSYRLTF